MAAAGTVLYFAKFTSGAGIPKAVDEITCLILTMKDITAKNIMLAV